MTRGTHAPLVEESAECIDLGPVKGESVVLRHGLVSGYTCILIVVTARIF